uniref:Uncharacterized protein n=1 Tax=Oryza sativa subsp. japonica TaxID=39947 RepID=Q6K1R3_ORYSJ|nr:hypothetical protein [Oryza sativa Japonica Group]
MARARRRGRNKEGRRGADPVVASCVRRRRQAAWHRPSSCENGVATAGSPSTRPLALSHRLLICWVGWRWEGVAVAALLDGKVEGDEAAGRGEEK